MVHGEMRHKCFLPSRRFPPLVAGATTFPPLCCGTMGAGQGCQFACGAATERNRTTGPVARWKCTPFGANAPPFPRWGNSSLRFPRISPSGGDAAAGGRRGAFPSRRRRGLPVFPPPARAAPRFYQKRRLFSLRAPPSFTIHHSLFTIYHLPFS